MFLIKTFLPLGLKTGNLLQKWAKFISCTSNSFWWVSHKLLKISLCSFRYQNSSVSWPFYKVSCYSHKKKKILLEWIQLRTSVWQLVRQLIKEVALQLCWNRTSAWVFSYTFAAYFRTPFTKYTSRWLLLTF